MSHTLFILALFPLKFNSTDNLTLTKNRSQTNPITEFITMCLWVQANDFHPIYVIVFKTALRLFLEQGIIVSQHDYQQ